MEEILAMLKDVKSGVDFEKETALVDDGILDSLDIITIISEISDRFGVDIDAGDITPENFNSASAIAELVESM